MKVMNKVIVVTGGGNGIGQALVLELLKRGATVAAVDMSEEGLVETVRLSDEDKERLSIHVTDITNLTVVEELPDQINNIHGAVDGIINCAGIIQPFTPINELDYSFIRKVMDVNFYGTLYMVKSFLPHLLKRPVAHVANVSSMAGFLPVPGQSVYGASKAAVKLLTEGLFSELRSTSVKVSVIFPGCIGTEIMKNSGVEGSRKAVSSKDFKYKVLSPQQAANIMLNGIERDKYRILVGRDAKYMDFLYRWNPQKATIMIANKL